MLDAQPPGDLGRDHHVGMVGEPVRPRQYRNSCRDRQNSPGYQPYNAAYCAAFPKDTGGSSVVLGGKYVPFPTGTKVVDGCTVIGHHQVVPNAVLQVRPRLIPRAPPGLCPKCDSNCSSPPGGKARLVSQFCS